MLQIVRSFMSEEKEFRRGINTRKHQTSLLSTVMAAFWNEEMKVFQCGKKVLSGLCPTLHTTFYPDFYFPSSFWQIRKKSKKRKSRSRTVPIWIAKKRFAASAPLSSSVPLSSSSSSPPHHDGNAGVRLDNEVDELVHLFTKKKFSLRDIASACYSVASSSSSSFESLSSVVSKWSVNTKALVVFLIEQGWNPHRSQLTVASVTHGVATRIDLLCTCPLDQTYEILENKVGYEYSQDCGKEVRMEFPFSEIDARIDHQHQLQLLGTHMLFESSFPHVPSKQIRSCILKHSSDGTITKIPLDPKFLERKSLVWSALEGPKKNQA